jgi:type III secretory pathway component EscT
MFIWNGVIRSMLELFYPTVLLAMSTVSKNLDDKSKLTLPVIQIGIFIGFFFTTVVHIE